MSRILLSVSDKRGLVSLASRLVERGHQLVSTGGTAAAIGQAGLPVLAVSEVTRVPEMLDGRVKTLHPAIHAGILARRARPDDMAALRREQIDAIDVVVVNLYPFADAAARRDISVDALVEEIDIGGPTLVRASAKSFQDVVVVVDPDDYDRLVEQLDRPTGVELAFRLEMARKAFAHTASYDQVIAATFTDLTAGTSGYERGAAGTASGPHLWLQGRKRQSLRYGENPHQEAGWYENLSDPDGFASVIVHQGKALSYTNLLDLDAACRIVLEFDEPAAVVIKHTNPCGVALGHSAADAYVRARDADALSAFGGIVGLNRPIDGETATALASTFIEAVVAPSVTDDALDTLAAKPALRVVTADFARFASPDAAGVDVRSILGGLLVQQRDLVQEARTSWSGESAHVRVVTARSPTADEWSGLRFAWRVCGHVKSNAVIFTTADRTAAIGAGQMSRVDAVKVAVMKAVTDLGATVVASDAFFPFRDGVDAVAAAGATAIVQPGGSKRDEDVIAAANEHGLAMVFTGRRHFRH